MPKSSTLIVSVLALIAAVASIAGCGGCALISPEGNAWFAPAVEVSQ